MTWADHLIERITRRPPDFVIGGTERPYLRRWFVIPRNPIFNIYLHQFLRSDDDRALHDHPWWFVSMMLVGKYREYMPGGGAEGQRGTGAEGTGRGGAEEQRIKGAGGVSGEQSTGEGAASHHSPITRHPGDWICETRRGGSIAFRRAEHRHRVELLKRDDGTPIPCWTVVLTGPNMRTWGFWCPKGFVPWHDFVSMDDTGDVGPGCGE
jgi:hypothetical protein